jgi:two-component system response regulator YesN
MIQNQIQPYENKVRWYLAVGEKTERLSGLPACFDALNHVFSYRHLSGRRHILTKESISDLIGGEDASSLQNIDPAKIDPALVRGFLQNGQMEEVEDFVREYIDSMRDAASSKLFSQYLMLNIRFNTIAYMEELGVSQQEAQELLPGMQVIASNVSLKELKEYICEMLRCALEQREQASKSQSRNLVRQAVEYIDRNFTDENISLKEVASYTNVSANYFSAVFSQEMRQTFVEYLTQKRMSRAKELLRQGDKRTAEVAAEVGYKDPHYFSFVFRKTQGCTPRDYRTGGKRG